MGLFSKLLDGLVETSEALDRLHDIARGVEAVSEIKQTAAEKRAQNIVSPDYKPLEQGVRPNSVPQAETSGKSWGPVMPKEENQFNSQKPYDRYFRDVFSEAFPEYEIVEEACGYSRPGTVFTFLMEGKKILVVEVISQRTQVERLRRKCRREGMPYLRYYYDHPGWWNTKEYVVDRTRNALA